MLSRHPYMLRALYEWLVDCGDMPHLLVDAGHEGVQVPGEFVQDGRIVLNVGPSAVQNLSLGNDVILFNARFNGQPMEVILPQSSVIAIYGRESGEGMMFNLDESEFSTDAESSPASDDPASDDDVMLSSIDGGIEDEEGASGKKRGKPNLKIIK